MTTELHEAVRSGDVARVRNILRRNPLCADDRNKDYHTPLDMVYCGMINSEQTDDRLTIIKILLDCGADVDDRDFLTGCTVLCYAVEKNEIEGVKLLLERGADPKLRYGPNSTALHYAMEDQVDNKIVELLLQYGADINAIDCNGYTPLDSAICSNNFDKAQIMINVGAKARKVFTEACYIKKHKDYSKLASTIELLIQKGAEIDLSGRFSVRALYYVLVKSHDVQLVEEVMVEQGVDVNELKRQGKGMTELHVAAQNADEAQVKTLMEAGVDVNATNVLGETPLHVLFDKARKDDDDRYYRTAKLLVEAGADLLEIQDIFDVTSFQKAMLSKSSKIINLILARISGVEESTLKKSVLESLSYNTIELADQSYPLAVAIELGHEEVVDRLIELQHHIEVKCDINYRPPIYHAVQWRNLRITKLLLEGGYRIDVSNRYNVHSFDFTIYDDLELVCLLWEFNCISILRKSFIFGFLRIVRKLHENKMIYLLCFYFKIGLRSNKLDEKFISITGVLRSNERLTSILASFDDQIDQLKKDLVCGNKSKYDILTMKLDSLVHFLNDENNLRACQELCSSLGGKEEWDSYEIALKFRIDLAMERRKILDSAKDCLNKALWDVQKSLPDEIIGEISPI